MNNKDISGCKIVAVNDESGYDPTCWDNGFVYIYDDSSLEEEVIYMSELDDKDATGFKPEALLYAVSLRELVLEAKKAGILDKLTKRTRMDLE
jgi:hypothetical protein